MGSIKELLFDIQEEWRHEWISINYPEAEEETLEWDAAAQEYSWFRDWMEEAAEQQHFEASLNCIPNAFRRPWMSYMSYKDFLKPNSSSSHRIFYLS
ncbi:TPA: hypothetical protein ACQ8KD_002738 [Escherichia coli]